MTNKLNRSVVLTIIGVLFLFAFAVIATLFAPRYVDPSWTNPTSAYQVQMYEVADPHLYISTASPAGTALQYVYHLKAGYTLLAFPETDAVKITAPPDLERYVTREGPLKLTTRLLLLRPLKDGSLELYDPHLTEAFALAETDSIAEPWAQPPFQLLGAPPYNTDEGALYVANPTEYRVQELQIGQQSGWTYSPSGERIESLPQLQSSSLNFISRQELIRLGEHIYAIEGCWYCHTDQSRTIIQDSVLNGTESYPAPPSSASEYIYQNVTFPGTRRIGPDLARTGVKRPYRDWHLAHFWSPSTESPGSIMPAFTHFFDQDPRGKPRAEYGLPNWRFEALYQYLLTKGTRITPPQEAWWRGGADTKELIER